AVDVVTDERFGESPPPVDRAVDADCPNCGSRLRARYAEEDVEIVCPDCSTLVHYGYFPPRGGTTRDPEALFDAYGKRLWREFTLADRGVCPSCSGRTRTRVERDSDHHLRYPAVSRCLDCGAEVATAIGLRLLADPTVVSFLADHGEGVDDRPFWEFGFCIDDAEVRAESEDPLRVVVPIRRGDETLRVTVDAAGTVVETARITSR
ncbi:transcriptional regulator, partial [Halobium palmae]